MTDLDQEPTETFVERHIELVTVVLIALTALLTAWASFQASRWGGDMSVQFSAAGAARTESVRSSNDANQQITVDVGLFQSFVDATESGDTDLADFYLERMPERLNVAMEAWLATDPLTNPDAPGSPFEMTDYVLEARVQAADLEDDADHKAAVARQANARREDYTLVAVFCATVIFLAALSTKVTGAGLRQGLVVLSGFVFVGVLVALVLMPVNY